MKTTALTVLLAGSMLLTACGVKTTETTAAPATVAATTTTPEDSTAETTPVETTAEITASSEIPPVKFNFFISSDDVNGKNAKADAYFTIIHMTGISYEEVDLGKFYNDESLLGMVGPVWAAHSDQNVVITLESSKEIAFFTSDNLPKGTKLPDSVNKNATLTREGNKYTLTIPANTVSSGDYYEIMLISSDNETAQYILAYV